MKNYIAILMITLLLSITSVNADDDEYGNTSVNTSITTTSKEEENMDEETSNEEENVDEESSIEEENIDEETSTGETIREQNRNMLKSKNEEKYTSILDVQKEFRDKYKALRDEYKDLMDDEALKEEYKAKRKALFEEYKEKIKEAAKEKGIDLKEKMKEKEKEMKEK